MKFFSLLLICSIFGISTVNASAISTCDEMKSCEAYCSFIENNRSREKLLVTEGKTLVAAFNTLVDKCNYLAKQSSGSYSAEGSLWRVDEDGSGSLDRATLSSCR